MKTHESDSGGRGDIPLRRLGNTGVDVSALGLGGYHLGAMKRTTEAVRLIHEAVDAGITFLDNAWEYHDGRSEELMGKAIADRRSAGLSDDEALHARTGPARCNATARRIIAAVEDRLS